MRKTIYMGKVSEQYLLRHSNHSGLPKASHSLSKAVNVAIDRYAEIIAKNIPSLEDNEWLLVVDALNESWAVEPAKNTLTIITGKLGEALDDQEKVSEYAVDAEALRKKLQGMSIEQKLAMLNVAEVFWLSLKEADPDLDDQDGIKKALAIAQRKED